MVTAIVLINAETTRIPDLAEQIAENAPLTLRSLNFSLRETARDPGDRDNARIRELIDDCMASEDYVEGRSAFMEKRKAVFD